MAKVLFIPFSIIGGLLAGLVGRKLFDAAWAAVDDQEPPGPEDRTAQWPKLLLAITLQGAIFSLARGIADHLFRRGFYRATGAWPGEERPDSA